MRRTAAGFHFHDAAPKTFDEALRRTPPHPTSQNNPAGRIQTR
jgi:hypothetical protein